MPLRQSCVEDGVKQCRTADGQAWKKRWLPCLPIRMDIFVPTLHPIYSGRTRGASWVSRNIDRTTERQPPFVLGSLGG